MVFLNMDFILDLHQGIIDQSGGSSGVRDWNSLTSSLSQPSMTFDGVDLYKTLIDKACALGYFLIANHPFVDGNKRIGHAAMLLMLRANELTVDAPIDDQEKLIFDVAAGKVSREGFTKWMRKRIKTYTR